jgi:hypothetical protein
MNTSDAAELHERTKHTWQRIRAQASGLDWGNQPVPFKLYPDLEPLPLPRQLPDSSLPPPRSCPATSPQRRQRLTWPAWPGCCSSPPA